MLLFSVYQDGKPLKEMNLAGAYLIGTDDIPVRAELTFKDGMIVCKKRQVSPAGIVLPWAVKDVGRVMAESVRVPERKQPYILQVELARGRLIRLYQKLEEWNLIDSPGLQPVADLMDQSRDALIVAMTADTPGEAARQGDLALSLAARAGELMSGFQAQLMQERRQTGGQPLRRFVGVSVEYATPTEALVQRLVSTVDFVKIPFHWPMIEPKEGVNEWGVFDTWVELLSKHKIPMRGSSLLSFLASSVPDWLFMWEHDFDAIRDMATEHTRKVLKRYGSHIQVWDIGCGINTNHTFSFSFEQIMELTRLGVMLIREIIPRSSVIIEILYPWGEYYSRNQRSIPPHMFADTLVQNGIPFDGLGLTLQFGSATDGYFMRDLFQVSSLLDSFSRYGRTLHVSAVSAPSITSKDDPNDGGGHWRAGWNEQTQHDWFATLTDIATQKSFVETLTWDPLIDPPASLKQPATGLMRADGAPKAAFQYLAQWKQRNAKS